MATDIKKLIDFESIKGILYLCYAHQDDKVDRKKLGEIQAFFVVGC